MEIKVTSTMERRPFTKLHIKLVGLARDKMDTQKDVVMVDIRITLSSRFEAFTSGVILNL